MIDTNCIMQIARNRPDAPQVRAMLDGIPASRIFVTDFTVHSLGVVMVRFGQIQAYEPLLTGLGIGREILVIEVDVGELTRVVSACTTHSLDFDDAY